MMNKFYFIFLFYLFFFGIVAAKPKEIDTTKPLRIKANEVKIQKNDNIIIFKGKVDAKQENLRMFSDIMKVNYEKDNNDKILIKTIVANNNVVLKNENITAKGDKAIYDFKEQLITLKGNIILNEKDAVVFGDILTYNIETKETKIKTEKNDNVIEEKNINNTPQINNKKRVVIILDNVNELKDRYEKK